MRSTIPRRPKLLGEAGSDELQHVCSEEEQDHAEPDDESARLKFQFIDETGLSRPRGERLRRIRSQARQRAHSQRRKTLSKGSFSVRRPHTKSVATSGSLVHPVPKKPNTSMHYSPASTGINPFDALRIDGHGDSQFLIHQYYSIFYPTDSVYSPIRPAFRKEEALEAALADPAHLHASLAHVAMTLGSIGIIDSRSKIIYHVGKAIAIVNDRIVNSNQKAVTIETVCAVTSLTGFELRTGSMTSVKIHLDGVEALVKSVGGLDALLSNPFTYKYTRWVDIVGAIVLGSKPRFDLVHSTPHPDFKSIEPCSLLAARYKARLFNLTHLPDLGEKMMEAYRILRHLIIKKERFASSQEMESTGTEPQSLYSYCTQLMYRLIKLIQYESPNLLIKNALIYRLFGNAAVAHILMFTYNMPPRSGTHVLLSSRLRACLEIIDVPSFQIAYPEMMLWIIIIGAMGSIGTADQEWFTQLLARSCCAAGISGTTELSLSLREFLWSDFYLGSIFEQFWEDVALAQATLQPGDEIG